MNVFLTLPRLLPKRRAPASTKRSFSLSGTMSAENRAQKGG